MYRPVRITTTMEGNPSLRVLLRMRSPAPACIGMAALRTCCRPNASNPMAADIPSAPEMWKNKAIEDMFMVVSFLFYLDDLGPSKYSHNASNSVSSSSLNVFEDMVEPKLVPFGNTPVWNVWTKSV